MRRILSLVQGVLILAGWGDSPAQSRISGASTGLTGAPLREVSAPLRNVWLRFHESDLCLGLDSVFLLQAQGMEIWCRIGDEKDYQVLTSWIEPLRGSFRIDVYATHPERIKKPFSPEADDPLPSLWTNAELRAYMRDPFSARFGTIEDDSSGAGSGKADPALKRSLKLFGDQIVEWQKKMERLSRDLPALADAGYGAEVLPDIRERARTVCRAHAREVGKCAARLQESLSRALPRGSASPKTPAAKSSSRSLDPLDNAQLIFSQTQRVVRRISGFLYPQAHTVPLSDLKEPGLIDAMKSLQATVDDFERSAKKIH